MTSNEGIYFRSPNSRQVQAARVSLGWSQSDLAAAAGVGVMSVRRLEALRPGEEPMTALKPNTVIKIISALEDHGIEFKYDQSPIKLGLYFRHNPFGE